jgi:hypothetical protein
VSPLTFLVFDEPFDGGQGVEAGRGQLGVQLFGLGNPAVAGAFGFIQGGIGAQGVEFVPGQVVPDRQPPRGISVGAAWNSSSLFPVAVAWAARSRARPASAVTWAGTKPRGAAMVIASARWRSAASRSPVAWTQAARPARAAASSVR